MRPSRTFGTDLWRTLIEKLDEGVIVFNQRGVVIYANDEAARLLDYRPRDVLELDKEDVLSLCDCDRLDGEQFAAAFLAEELGENSDHAFEVVTSNKRLILTPLALDLERGRVIVLLLRESVCWRGDLIAQTLMTDVHSPLTFTAEGAAMLRDRVKSGDAHPYELSDLARIISESHEHTLGLYSILSYLHQADPRQMVDLEAEPVDLEKTFRKMLDAFIERTSHQLPDVKIGFPHDLPAVRASQSHLEMVLAIVLEQSLLCLPEGDILIIKGSNRTRYVQLDMVMGGKGSKLRSHLLDKLPLAAAEQIVRQHGGRVWIHGRSGHLAILSLALPIWDEDHEKQ
ncbi:MAG: PAS domain-containing protein [Anaerolineae bacterium]|nr:PAS domain-containing protein [Anaerolineae bacterium]